MTTVAIIGALEEEVAHIADSLEDATHIAAASLDVVRGTLTAEDGGTINVAATVGGMGLVNAAATTQYLIDLCHPDAVIFSGIAGNLNKALHINDVVLGGTLRYLDTDMRLVGQWKPGTPDRQVAEFHSDPRLLAVAGAALGRRSGFVVGALAALLSNFLARLSYPIVDAAQPVRQLRQEIAKKALTARGGLCNISPCVGPVAQLVRASG